MYFDKSDKQLANGAIYSIVSAVIFLALGILIFIGGRAIAPNLRLDPLSFLFLAALWFATFMMAFYITIVSIVCVVFGFIARKKHKRKFYKMCHIFSSISLNPVSKKGCKTGMEALETMPA